MFGGLLVLPIVGVVAAGGWTNLTTELQSTDENLLRPMGQYGFSVAGIMGLPHFRGQFSACDFLLLTAPPFEVDG